MPRRHRPDSDFNRRPFPAFEEGKHFYLGPDRSGKARGWDLKDERHMVLVAGAGAGKNVSCIIPALLTYPGSCLVIDPKGENARYTKTHRERMGQVCHVLDPFGHSPFETTSSLNPVEALSSSPTMVDDAALLADALIPESGGKEDVFWNISAKNLIKGLLLYFAFLDGNLLNVRRALALPEAAFKKLLKDMTEHRLSSVVEAATSMQNKEKREQSGILSTAVEQLGFLESPSMERVLSGHDFDFSSLKTQPTTIYLCLPGMRMNTHARWLRLMITLAITEIERVKTKPEFPVLFILDEMHVLGHMGLLETAAGLMRGYSLKLWSVFQDITQAKNIYKDRWETFFGNAGLRQFFGNVDYSTCEYISKLMGQSYYSSESSTRSMDAKGEVSFSEQDGFQDAPLLTPDEVALYFAREMMNQLVMVPHLRPSVLQRTLYFNHPEFKKRAGIA